VNINLRQFLNKLENFGLGRNKFSISMGKKWQRLAGVGSKNYKNR
jgi:hypothetical protein